MNPAHLHLLVNHFPVIGTLIGFLVLVAGFLLNKSEIKQTAFGIFIFTALAALPAYFSGESAEEVLEKLPGFEEAYVEAHEEAAVWAITLVELLGVAASAALFFTLKHNPLQKTCSFAVLLLALIALAAVARTNNLGGQISHPEIRTVTDSAPQSDHGAH